MSLSTARQLNPCPEFATPKAWASDGMVLRSIFHPSDFSEASEIAFVHALKFALATGANLTMLHAAAGPNTSWQCFPALRETLTRWKLLAEGSTREAVSQLGIAVRKVLCTGGQPVRDALRFLEACPAELMVLAVHQREGFRRWMKKPVGKQLALKSGQMTLFIPYGVEGFVSRDDGSVTIRNILIPVAGKPFAQPALEIAAHLISSFDLPSGVVTLLHVGGSGEAPALRIPEAGGWAWNSLTRRGDPADVILNAARETEADLIIMSTDGCDGLMGALRGSTSERVLHKTRCPLVSLPVGARLS